MPFKTTLKTSIRSNKWFGALVSWDASGLAVAISARLAETVVAESRDAFESDARLSVQIFFASLDTWHVFHCSLGGKADTVVNGADGTDNGRAIRNNVHASLSADATLSTIAISTRLAEAVVSESTNGSQDGGAHLSVADIVAGLNTWLVVVGSLGREASAASDGKDGGALLATGLVALFLANASVVGLRVAIEARLAHACLGQHANLREWLGIVGPVARLVQTMAAARLLVCGTF